MVDETQQPIEDAPDEAAVDEDTAEESPKNDVVDEPTPDTATETPDSDGGEDEAKP